MGTLRQLSVLKGPQTEKQEGKLPIHELFNCAARVHRERLAILYEDGQGQGCSVTYGELNETTNRLARVLQRYPKPNGAQQHIVAVCLKPSDRLLKILLATLKAGMCYLPLDEEFPLTRVKHVLQEAKPTLVVLEKDADLTIYDGTTCSTFEDLWNASELESSDSLMSNNDPERIAIVLYTSGSTGIPKGVLLPHATIMNRLNWQWREFPFNDDEEKCVFKTSLTFVDSVPEIWGPLLQGRTLVVVPKPITKDPEKFIQLLDRHEIQRLVLVPSLLRSLLMYANMVNKNSILKSLRFCICSGESLPTALAEQYFATFNDRPTTLANFYGSTEIMGDVTYHLLNGLKDLQELDKVPIGKPLDNCIIYIVNNDLTLVPQGEIGEILVAGRNLAAGYINDGGSKKFTSNSHSVDPGFSRVFCTGDYAKVVKGVLVYEGRVDSQIKVRGHRVNLTEVEKAVYRSSDVEKVAVLCHKPGELSQALLAFVTLQNNSTANEESVESFLRNILPPYMLPKVVVVDRIPLLVNGKIDRQLLLKQYESMQNKNANRCSNNCDYHGVHNRDLPKAKVLFETVASITQATNSNPITVDANFYQLGGNSLNSIYTVMKLRDQGYEISISDFLTAPTLGDVLSRMKLDSTNAVKSEKMSVDNHYFEMLNDSHKKDAIEIVTESFYAKADLEQWLMPDVARQDYYDMMEILWPPLVEKGLSFAVKSAMDNRTIGVGFNFDLWDEPELMLKSKLLIVFDFLEYLEAPIRENKLPKGKGKILHSFMMTTSGDLNAAENVIAMGEMEEYCLQLAKEKGYIGIFTTNTSPLTQQLGTDVYGYDTMLTYQVNKYVAPDGTKPFGKAPDSQVAVCALKMLDSRKLKECCD